MSSPRCSSGAGLNTPASQVSECALDYHNQHMQTSRHLLAWSLRSLGKFNSVVMIYHQGHAGFWEWPDWKCPVRKERK